MPRDPVGPVSLRDLPRHMPIRIADRTIGSGSPCFIIAEAGVNHNGSLALAIRLVDAAARAGADAVKFQTFKAEKIVSPVAPKAEYQIANTQSSESQLEMVKALELTFDEFRHIYDHCQIRKILFLSTAFDEESADFLDELGMPAFKVPSGEITNLPLLVHIARKRKPILMSTGMSNLEEVREALNTILRCGNDEVVVLQCTSNYPADPSTINLRAMATMRQEFDLDIGYSDHSQGIEIPLAAVALGACVIEKHFTTDRTLCGPDHKASLEPEELKSMISAVRNVEASLGDGLKRPSVDELKTAQCARRSLVAARRIAAGTLVTEDMVTILRPGTGLPPAMKAGICGKRVLQDLEAGELFSVENLG
jgi:N,N'-diacetyllegionaminate synthase